MSKGFYAIAAVLLAPVALGQAKSKLQILPPVPVHAPAALTPTLTPAAAAALGDMARRAGVVFAGRVLAVDRQDAAGFVDVRFAVDAAVKGCAAGRPYVLREWAGLWASGTPRYLAGERLLVLLTGRSRSGFSAPVDGFAGVLPLQAMAAEPLADTWGIAPAEDGSDVLGSAAQGVGHVTAKAGTPVGSIGLLTVDLRWLQATLERPSIPGQAYRSVSRSSAPVRLEQDWVGPVGPLTVGRTQEQAAQGTPIGTILTLLRAASGPAGSEQ